MSATPNETSKNPRKYRSYTHLTKEFVKQKANFAINDKPIDPLIKDFVMQLNESKDIVTMFSCEAHAPDDHPYLFFNVSEDGSIILWNIVIPNILVEASAIGLFFHIEVYTDEGSTNGIVFRGYYPPEDWEKGKMAFWYITSKHMLRHFLPTELMEQK